MRPEYRNCSPSNETSLPKPGVFKSIRLVWVWILAALLLQRWNCFSFRQIRIRETAVGKVQLTPDQHTIPTLLSVVDSTTGNYVNALNNPLYDEFKKYDGFFESNGIPVVAQEVPRLLKLYPAEIRIREPLTLAWTLGIDDYGRETVVRDDDVLALSCSSNHEENRETFLDFATIAQAKATSAKHGGKPDNRTWYFPGFSVLRHNECWFSLYRKPSDEDRPQTLLAISNRVRILDAQSTPTAIHLAYSSNIDEMVIQFKTGAEGTPIVKYGSSELNHMASGTSHTYDAQDMCQEPATQQEAGKFQPPGNIHVVTLKGLDPDTTYWYRVGLLQQTFGTVWSETFSFASAPLVQADAKPFTLLVYGDQGCPSPGWENGGVWTSEMAAREVHNGGIPVRAVHHFGDLSYAVGAAHVWDEWFHMISPLTTFVPLMVGIGNHEYDHTDGGKGKDPSGVETEDGYRPTWGNFHNDSGGECGVPTANHFIMPKSKGSNGVFWFSHDLASVHTLMISSEHDLSPGSIQHEWLKDDLQAVDRTVTPWVILELHRPLYESEVAKWDYKVGVALRIELEDLLLKYDVDLVLAGHYHTYQRSCQGLYKSKCNSAGPLYITVGSAGASLTKNSMFPNQWTEKFIQETYGYGRITVANATALHFEFVQAGSGEDPDAGHVLDDVWLTKQGNTANRSQPATRSRGYFKRTVPPLA